MFPPLPLPVHPPPPQMDNHHTWNGCQPWRKSQRITKRMTLMVSSIRVTKAASAGTVAMRPALILVSWRRRSTNCCRMSDRTEEGGNKEGHERFHYFWYILVYCAKLKLYNDRFHWLLVSCLFVVPEFLFASVMKTCRKCKTWLWNFEALKARTQRANCSKVAWMSVSKWISTEKKYPFFICNVYCSVKRLGETNCCVN